MDYIIDIALLISLVLLAAAASHFRLRKRIQGFWGFVGLSLIYWVAISFVRGRDLYGVMVDLLGLALVFFLVDLFMERMKAKAKKQ